MLGLLLIVAIVWIVTGAAIIVQAGRSDTSTADAALVMLGDGAMNQRLDRARQLYSEGKIARILLAGPNVADGRASLQQRGVQDEALIDVAQPDQIAQLAAAKQMLEQENLRSVVLIAEPAETLRLLKIARDADLRPLSTPIGAPDDLSIAGVTREVGRYFRYVLLSR